ncbi:hypothetical protein KI387_008144, partial [Taxus chinensis]
MDWGGTCFARYGLGHNPTGFISKTDEIMSKYRRIAPKPTAVTTSTCESNSNSKSDLKSALGSRSKFNTRKGNKNNNTGRGATRRNRNRRRGASDGPKTPSPRGPKRARGPSKPSDLAGSERVFKTVGATVPTITPKAGYHFDGSPSAEKLSVERDLGFVERAAASAVTEGSVLQKKTTRFGGLNIKGVMDSLGKVAVQNHMEVVPVQRMPDTQCSCGFPKYLNFPIVSDIQQQQEVEKNGKNLVTLPLLPGTPSLRDEPVLGSPSSSYTSTDHRPDMPDKGEFQLRLFGINVIQKKDVSCQINGDESQKRRAFVPPVDFAFIEKKYSGSVNPVILLLDSESKDVLWFNPAYERMVKDTEERSCNIHHPLAINPTPLACCKSDFQGMVSPKAFLWGFKPETVACSYNGTSYSGEHNLMYYSSPSTGHPMQRSTNVAMPGISPTGEGLSSVNNGVIMPQPVRPVGSSVSIEYLKETNEQISPPCKTMDEIKEQMEKETFPALISDSKNRVKWANSAYKKMVGQPECSWLESTVCCYNNNSEGPLTSRINGEVVLKDGPFPASAFSCYARIQWTDNKGEKISIRATCEVSKFVMKVLGKEDIIV